MEILIAGAFSPNRDGVANVVWAHAQGFIKAGHHVTIATQYHRDRHLENFPPGMTVKQFKIRGNRNLRVGLTGAVSEYTSFIRSCRVQIAFFHCWETPTTDLVTPLLPELPFKKVLVSHGVTANSRLFWPRGIPTWLGWRPYVLQGIPSALPLFDRVVYLSDQIDRDRFVDRHISARLGLQNGSVIPNGVHLESHDQAQPGFRAKYGLQQGLVLLCVGRYDKYKNGIGVAEAVLHSGITDATLVLIGPAINDYTHRIQQLWTRRNPTGLRLLCLQGLSSSEILQAYKEADIYIQASRTECLPLVILDAMASATPFASSDVGCVRHLPGGIVGQTQHDLARAIRALAQSPALRRELGEMGRRACESRYSWPIICNDYLTLAEALITESTYVPSPA
jgi:glycosyltransferase involved in cell wall biosynthesis